MLRSAQDLFPLVALFHEEIDADACHIGRVAGLSNDAVELLEIDPDAKWHEAPTSYLLETITRVDFGGDYEGALALVGGRPGQ